MRRIVFVCHGNICRSPMAEFVLKNLLERHHVEAEVGSRATSREEIWGEVGNPIYPPAQEVMRRHGIAYDKGKRAKQLSKADVAYYDDIVVMDSQNLNNVLRMYPQAKPKVRKLLDYCGGGDVADPWYTGDFDAAYSDIRLGCQALLQSLGD